MVIVRENTEGLYSGIENEIVPGVVTSLKVASRTACIRIARYAFRYATAPPSQKYHRLPQSQHHEIVGRPLPRLCPADS